MFVMHGGHRNEVENESTELGEHFARSGKENISSQTIDCVKKGEYEALAIIQLSHLL